MYDLVISGAKIVDGTGNPWFRSDVGVKDGKIQKIGKIEEKGPNTLFVEDKFLAPGFIDIHSHYDLDLLTHPKGINKIAQGVTTEVTGNCGISMAPLEEETVFQLKEYVKGISDSQKTDYEWDWHTSAEYFDKAKENGLIENIAPLVGHGTIRLAAMGFDKRVPSEEELAEMKDLLAREMDERVFGLSSGLIYPPGSFSETDELIQLSMVLKEYDGLYSSHVRSETDNIVDAYEEAIQIGKANDIKVQISHHKACGKRNWGKVQKTLNLIETARKEGLDVTSDQYPYKASCTHLSAFLPRWLHEGGVESLLKRLQDDKTRNKIIEQIEEDEAKNWENGIKLAGLENIVIASVKTEKNRDLEGFSLDEAAGVRNKGPYEFIFDLLVEEESQVRIFAFSVKEEDLRSIMKHHTTIFGSDGRGLSPKKPEGKPHPRNYGTFPRILEKYVRKENVLSLEEAIRKMTSFPAQKIGLKKRGSIKEGNWADLVILDPQKLKETTTYENPPVLPEGIDCVFVNGEKVLEKNKLTENEPGMLLKKK